MNRYKFSFDANVTVLSFIKEILDSMYLDYHLEADGTIAFTTPLKNSEHNTLTRRLREYQIEIKDKEDDTVVNRIKSILKQVVYSEDFRSKKISSILTDELGYSYSHLSHLFSKATYTSIENFLILVKIEKAKELLMHKGLNLTEVAHKLDYSSVSHLSQQFKNVTGLTVSQFLKHIKLREN